MEMPTHDYVVHQKREVLGEVAGELNTKYPESVWTKKASVWSD